MKYYGDLNFQIKDDLSPLTQADLASHQEIVSFLSKYSTHLVCSEEAILSNEVRQSSEYLWLVDPLDGTKDFLAQNDEFCINIALIYQQRPILGVIGIPAKNEIYFAIQGEGAFCYQNQVLRKITFNSQANQRIFACISHHHHTDQTQAFITKYNLDTISLGSAIKFCALAEGRVDFYPRFNGSSEWDSAAGDLIVSECGGEILSVDSKEPLLYNKPIMRNPYFVGFSQKQIKKEVYLDFIKR